MDLLSGLPAAGLDWPKGFFFSSPFSLPFSLPSERRLILLGGAAGSAALSERLLPPPDGLAAASYTQRMCAALRHSVRCCAEHDSADARSFAAGGSAT